METPIGELTERRSIRTADRMSRFARRKVRQRFGRKGAVQLTLGLQPMPLVTAMPAAFPLPEFVGALRNGVVNGRIHDRFGRERLRLHFRIIRPRTEPEIGARAVIRLGPVPEDV